MPCAAGEHFGAAANDLLGSRLAGTGRWVEIMGKEGLELGAEVLDVVAKGHAGSFESFLTPLPSLDVQCQNRWCMHGLHLPRLTWRKQHQKGLCYSGWGCNWKGLGEARENALTVNP